MGLPDTSHIVFLFTLTFLITLIATHVIVKISFSKNIVGRDVHKPWDSYASGIGGISLLTGVLTPLIFYSDDKALVIVLSSLLALIIGLVDDLKRLQAITKTLLSTIPGVPLIIFNQYYPYPYIPFIGEARLILLYPILILLGYAVALNAVNMSDTHNGLIAGVLLIFFSSILPLIRDHEILLFILSMIASLSAFLIYNSYPAKSFVGNSGSFILGSWVASVSFVERIEYLTLIALFPLVINGFSIIISVRGLKERREITVRPVKVVSGLIYGNKDPKAPVTLANIASLRKPLRETEFVIAVYMLVFISTILSISLFYVK
ncbi:MAG: hypothetical protein ACP5I7_03355 [Sulfolobales archaeon]